MGRKMALFEVASSSAATACFAAVLLFRAALSASLGREPPTGEARLAVEDETALKAFAPEGLGITDKVTTQMFSPY